MSDIFFGNLEAIKQVQFDLWKRLKDENPCANPIESFVCSEDIKVFHGVNDVNVSVFVGCSHFIAGFILKSANESQHVSFRAHDDLISILRDGFHVWLESGGQVFSARYKDDSGAECLVNKVVIVHEWSLDELLPLLSLFDVSELIRNGKMFFHVGYGVDWLAEILFPCFNRLSYITTDSQFALFKQIVVPIVNDLLSRFPLEDSLYDKINFFAPKSATIPEVIRAGCGGTWLFLIRLPSSLDLFSMYLDLQSVLKKKDVTIESMIIFPGTLGRFIADRIRSLSPDCVCDLYSLHGFYSCSETLPRTNDNQLKIVKSNIPWI